ncbi:riboflavin kinase [Clydaea vesicula]|uniref:Riboflavin kinase n=1 Tax=Clydaea vesicula TaxID=447962 RepID=A0AAD5UBV1_9FUNG|nr:riboflavin kinase [Clydaea vesicula]
MTEIVDERPLIVGPEIVQNPYPIYLKGLVTKGFGRGSKDLGIPTANLPEVVAAEAQKVLKTGIYYGWASVGDDLQVYPMGTTKFLH